MLYTIAVVLLILWLLGLVSGYTIGAFIHVLLVVAVVLFRRVAERPPRGVTALETPRSRVMERLRIAVDERKSREWSVLLGVPFGRPSREYGRGGKLLV